MKTDDQIKTTVEKARRIVQMIYKDDERLKKGTTPDSGIARETDIVFREVLSYLLHS